MWLSYDDKYDISSEGEIRHKKSKRTTFGSMMKIGYYKHCTRTNNKITQYFVHRMVAERFLPRIDIEGLVVDHINRIKTDNRASNLRWCSVSVNMMNKNHETNTGEKHINVYYEVQLPGHRNRYQTIEEAIIARDKIINP